MSKKDQAKGEGPQYADLVAGLRKQFLSGKTKSLAWRREQLTQVQMMFEENHDEITEAVRADLGGPKLRGLAELGPHKGAQMALDNLSRWTADEPVSTPFTVCPTLLASSFVRTEPKGVVLVISPWNYPIDLALGGVVSAIAAGNTIVLKPSEISQNSARVIEKLCNKYLDTSCIRVVMGAVPETTALLKERFDHIFYTGNGTVGRIIMRAASEHLTPVTLELGGKSPVIIDKTAKMTSVVERISTAKWINVGQTCIAPDYLLVHESIAQEVIDRLVEYTKAYKPTAKESKDYGRVISERHAQRLRDLLVNTKGKVLTGGAGDVDIANRFVPPTIITDVALDDPVLSDEIFGPILPIITIKDTTEALATIQKVCPTPLALYVFSEDTKQTKMILDNTQSGNVCINTCLEHYMNQNLPFGGTGSSGIGKVHGYYGFAEMSHKRGCLKQDTFIKKTAAMGRPPLNDKAYNTLIKVLMTGFIPRRVRPTFRIVTMMLLLFVLYRFVNKLIPTSL